MHLFVSGLLILLQTCLSTAAPPEIPASLSKWREEIAQPQIISASFSGNGCPQGTTTTTTTTKGIRDQFTVRLAKFKVATTPPEDKTANCQAHINLGPVRSGQQFALSDFWSTGNLVLRGEGIITLSQYVTIYFSRKAKDSTTAVSRISSSSSSRPIDRDVILHTKIPRDELVWSDCGGGGEGLLNVNFRMAFTSMSPDDPEAYYGFYGGGGGGGGNRTVVSERLGWTWRRC
ncbi:hypothetical protein GGS20DRAFT_422803 [Poronia punctata]|nr:hypothetical protein GGS20DRAFT_422803 [Poronia punctata]